MKKVVLALGVAATVLFPPHSTQASHDAGTSFVDREYVAQDQLITCNGLPSVYFVDGDGKRYVFPNSQTFNTWYPEFSFVSTVDCADLAAYSLGGVVTYQPGTRYVKLASNPKVYAVTPGGVLRAIPDEIWMNTFVGANWNTMIDDVPDAFWPSYDIGEPLDLMEIPDGMTAVDPDTDISYYFVDGQPKSLDGISFNYRHNDHFKAYTRTQTEAPGMYSRTLPAMKLATRIEITDELYLGTPKLSAFDDAIDADEFPAVRIIKN